MPKREDIKTVMVIGSGPIVIGQACEFDYSGTQGVKALREEGYRVVLVNSNPATIMTDPEIADRTYVEPLTVEILEAVIAREKPDAVLPTVGGQTALNLAVDDRRQRAARQRLDVRAPDQLRVRHDRRRVRVDQHHVVAERGQRLGALGARVVELAGLADDDRARPDQ